MADDSMLTLVENTLKEVGVTPPKESFGACLRPVHCPHDQENITSPIQKKEVSLL